VRSRIAIVGAGPAGLSAARGALATGHEVVVLERAQRVGGQLALAARSPGGRAIAEAFLANHQRTLAGVELRLGIEATPELLSELEPDAVVSATGAAPYAPDVPLACEATQAWEILMCDPPTGQRFVVADWGGDPTGLDAADVLSTAGNDVTLAVATVTVGESVHQYRRNLYLQRLYRAGVAILQHHELLGAREGEAYFANVFAPELRVALPFDRLVLAVGRVPVDGLAPTLRSAGLAVEEAGDCLSPRSLEEAVLEGALAVERLSATLCPPS
jgi:pyruvate/2-oxoglutarate dehydrogenase complex dihydrolipoamide dehydrogenase (E3) component